MINEGEIKIIVVPVCRPAVVLPTWQQIRETKTLVEGLWQSKYFLNCIFLEVFL